MRKSAVLTALFVMAATLVAFALPAGAGTAYPPGSTTPTSQPASQQAARLAFTGSDSTPLLVIALIALTLGTVLVVAARRRATMRSS